MIVIIPFKIFGYIGITLWPFIFIYKECREHESVINHERIHYAQQVELLVVGFYIVYVLNFLFNLFWYKSWNKAYRNIIFEREAYKYQGHLKYLNFRTSWAFLDN